MNRLERFRGHFYNWYDTRDLRASGSALRLHRRQRQSRGPPDRAGERVPRLDRSAARTRLSLSAGIRDSLNLAREARLALPDDRRMHATSPDQIDAAIAALAEALDAAEAADTEIATRLAALLPPVVTLVDIVRTLAGEWSGDAAGGSAFLERSDEAVDRRAGSGMSCRRKLRRTT